MYDRWLLDAPKLLDASALFGFSNPALARRLLASAVRLEPRYADDLAEAIGAAAEAHAMCSSVRPWSPGVLPPPPRPPPARTACRTGARAVAASSAAASAAVG